MSLFKSYPCTMQHDASDCEAAAISPILLKYKCEYSIMKIREIIGTDAYGTSVKGIVDGLEKLHFNVKAIRTTTFEITRDMTFPAIAQNKTEEGLIHFVVIHKMTKYNRFVIADPDRGLMKVEFSEFDKLFTGVLVLMVPNSEFEKVSYKDTGMFDLFKVLILSQKKLLTLIILASLLLSGIGILLSLFPKILMDEIIPYQMKNSLSIFLIVFGLVTLFQILTAFRQHILLFLSRKIDIYQGQLTCPFAPLIEFNIVLPSFTVISSPYKLLLTVMYTKSYAFGFSFTKKSIIIVKGIYNDQ
ncbi:cysteine peptidase family C39 domain-containing protein [Rossellomorea oryzaecorticis]|uniref:Cysteine peptidase family C39 domain-containing protein n=1 Tax=Rossellomorea oryzaecorticis TaxID=1396505 RepID=A0ABU9K3X8_9BACI